MAGNNIQKDFEKHLEQQDKEYAELKRKQKEIEAYQIETKHESIKELQKQLEITQQANPTEKKPEVIKKIQAENTDYLRRAKNSSVFINNDFKGKIPYFARNLLLLGAVSGSGKSTTAANLAWHALKQGQRVLLITNEENVADVYNRVTCLIKGWSYANHEEFTEDQIKIFNKYIEVLSERLKVVDDVHNGEPGLTTTIEGFENLLTALMKANKEDQYDVVIVDYYQNIDRSIKHPNMQSWEILQRAAKAADNFKNHYNGPIVMLAQLKPQNQKDHTSFKERIEGRKMIYNVCTCAMEIVADRINRKTDWHIIKSRFPESIGEVISTGYYKGKYVPYTDEFKQRVLQYNEEKQIRDIGVNINPISLEQDDNEEEGSGDD